MKLQTILHMSSYRAGILFWHAWLQGAHETPVWVPALTLLVVLLLAAAWPFVERYERRHKGGD